MRPLLAVVLGFYFSAHLVNPALAQDQKISQLPSVTSPTVHDEIPVNNGGITRKMTISQIGSTIGYTSHAADATIHRTIQDTSTSTTALWSAHKINSELAGKANTSHSHSASEITSGTLSVLQGGTGLNTITAGKLLYASGPDTLSPLSLNPSLAISAGVLYTPDGVSQQKLHITQAGLGGGIRKQINFIAGSQVALTVSDNAANDRVDVTISGTALGSPKGYLSGDPITWTSGSSVTIPSGLTVRDSTNTMDIVFTSDQVVNIATSGANGLDTGTEANTAYALWAIADSTGSNLPKGLLSLSGTSPTLPGGYNRKAYLGGVANVAGDILKFIHYPQQRLFELEVPQGIATSVNPTTWTNYSASAIAPPGCTRAVFNFGVRGLSSSSAASSVARGSTFTGTAAGGKSLGVRGTTGEFNNRTIELGLDASLQVQGRVDNASNANFSLAIEGFYGF